MIQELLNAIRIQNTPESIAIPEDHRLIPADAFKTFPAQPRGAVTPRETLKLQNA